MDIKVKIEDAQPIAVNVDNAQPININMGEAVNYYQGGGDKHYTQAFTFQSTVEVPHNLDKHPAVNITDSAGEEVEGLVIHQDDNNLTLIFSSPFTGVVNCN